MKIAMRPLLPVLLSLPLLWGGCFDTSRVAGGGGVIGNPPIAGTLLDRDGKPVSYARVALYRTDYSPVAGDTITAMVDADASGNYLLKDVPADTYNIVAAAAEGKTLGMIAGIVVPPGDRARDSVHAQACVLAERSSITISLANLDVVEGGYFYLPGTGVARQIDSAALRLGVLTLESVPAGSFSALHYVKDKAAAFTNILRKPLEAKSGGSSVVGPYQAWKYSRKVFINTAASGAAIGETVLGFPLLVRLDNANFDFNAARDSGQDVRFAKSDGVASLPYQIERWDRAGGRAEIWVRVDTVRADDDSQFIFLFAGRDSLASQSRGEGVFDTADGFTAVWHLGEDAGGAQPVYRDAAGFGNHGTGEGLKPESNVEGVIGRALALDGSTQYVRVPDAASLDLQAMTFSAWIKADILGGRVLDKITEGINDGYSFDTYGGKIRVCASPDNYSGLSPLATGQFIHIAATFDGRTTRFFLDGIPDGETDSISALPPNGFDLRIGSSSLGSQKFRGVLDEARISRTALPGSWIKMSYENQKPGSRVVGVR